MNRNIISNILDKYFLQKNFYIITLLDKCHSLILLQKVVYENKVNSTIQELAKFCLKNKYTPKEFKNRDVIFNSGNYRLDRLFNIPDQNNESNLGNYRIYVRRTNIEI